MNIGDYSLDKDGDVNMKNVLPLLLRLQNGDETVELDDIKKAMGLSVKTRARWDHLDEEHGQNVSGYAQSNNMHSLLDWVQYDGDNMRLPNEIQLPRHTLIKLWLVFMAITTSQLLIIYFLYQITDNPSSSGHGWTNAIISVCISNIGLIIQWAHYVYALVTLFVCIGWLKTSESVSNRIQCAAAFVGLVLMNMGYEVLKQY